MAKYFQNFSIEPFNNEFFRNLKKKIANEFLPFLAVHLIRLIPHLEPFGCNRREYSPTLTKSTTYSVESPHVIIRYKKTFSALCFYSVLLSISVFKALSTVFHSINSPDNSPFSHSVLSVFFLPYRSLQLYISL